MQEAKRMNITRKIVIPSVPIKRKQKEIRSRERVKKNEYVFRGIYIGSPT